MEAKYVIKEKKGLFYFELHGTHGRVLMKSETYSSEAGLANGIQSVQRNASTVIIEDKRDHKAAIKNK